MRGKYCDANALMAKRYKIVKIARSRRYFIYAKCLCINSAFDFKSKGLVDRKLQLHHFNKLDNVVRCRILNRAGDLRHTGYQ